MVQLSLLLHPKRMRMDCDLNCQTTSEVGQGGILTTVIICANANASPIHTEQLCGWKYLIAVAVKAGSTGEEESTQHKLYK